MELVDTTVLGTVICEFKSRQGYLGNAEAIVKRFVDKEINFIKKFHARLAKR